MSELSKPPPTVYVVLRLRDGRYAVEIAKPGEVPVSVKPFRTENEAKEWIEVERMRTTKDDI
jgi:hypothetical protein